MPPASPQFRQLQMLATGDELMSMESRDYGRPMRDVTPADREREEDAAHGGGYRRGSPDFRGYITAMTKWHDDNSGIDLPVHVNHRADGSQVLMDGNHRAHAALETGRLVPVVHHSDEDHDGRHSVQHSVFLGRDADPEVRERFNRRGIFHPSQPTAGQAPHG